MSKKQEELESKIKKAKQISPDFAIGLTDEQVQERKKEGLINKVPKKVTKSYWRILLDNVFTFFNLIYFVLAVLMAYGKTPLSSFFFLGPVVGNILVGVITDIRARLLVDKLRLVTDPKANVIRNGKEIPIGIRELVLSDVVILRAGEQVSADSLVLNGRLYMDESLVTGESVKIEKRVGDTVLSGTFVQSGKAYVRVIKVGVANYAEGLQNNAKRFSRPKSELKRSFFAIFTTTGIIAVIFGLTQLFVWLIQYNWNVSYLDYQAFISGLSGSLVAMIPAGLYLLTSLTLAVGVLSLAKKRMNVQELYCIEMLARVDTICFDKTGTLTDGKLALADIFGYSDFDDKTIRSALRSIVEATGDENGTAKAIKDACKEDVWKAESFIPFDSLRKLSAASFEKRGTFVLGAPSFIDASLDDYASLRIQDLSQKGYRVLGLYWSKKKIENENTPAKLKLIALISLVDHIKPDAKANIEWFTKNDVAIKIISGDNPTTVSEIASLCGVPDARKYISMQGVKDEDIATLVDQYAVFGRVNPEQKSLLIAALQEKGHKVAMTGDGVNDILALKKADCSIAMASGSSAAQNASHIVSLDNDFSKLPDVVAEGRRVINNLQRTSALFLSKTFFAITVTTIFLISSLCGSMSYPFTTSNMILWEFFTIGIGGFLLALQPSKERLKGKFMQFIISHALPSGLMEMASVLIIFVVHWCVPSFLSASAATALAVMVFSALSYLTMYVVSSPMDKYRGIVFLTLALAGAAFFLFDSFGPLKLWGIDYSGLDWKKGLVAVAVYLICGGCYLFGTALLKKRENREAKGEQHEN